MSEHSRKPMKRPMGMKRGMVPGEKAKDFKGSLSKLIKYISCYKVALIVIIILGMGGTLFNIIGPKVLSKATTEIFNGLMAKLQGHGGIDFNKIGYILLVLLGLYIISTLLVFIQGWMMTEISQKICFKLRQEISEKINRMPLGYFETRTVGEVLSRITNDVDTLNQSLNQSMLQLVSCITTLVGVIIMMLTISPLMTGIVLLTLPISAFLIKLVVGKSQRHFISQQRYLGEINGQIEEVYSGHNVIKAFNKEKEVLENFEHTNHILFESAFKSQFLSGLMQPLMMLVGNLGYVAVSISGAFLTIYGAIQVGDIQAFIQYVKNFTQPISQLAQISNLLQSAMAAAERVFEFLGESEEEDLPRSEESTIKNEGRVSFEHVSFGYNKEQTIINDFSCEVYPGQTVAIVGPTGAGKTTMIKLLMRFYDVNSGCIKLDGKDIRTFNRHELREHLGMVLQDTWLFKGSIMENIRYGKLEATDEEVIKAAKLAHADHFIRTLPEGYHMELNEEASNVSQGQKQLITIARALIQNSPIIILDEATSSVDTRTEIQIQKAMNRLMKGRTSFVIAHRLSTIKEADVILVMKDGDIIEQGNHKTLLAKGGFYAQLYNAQFEDIAE